MFFIYYKLFIYISLLHNSNVVLIYDNVQGIIIDIWCAGTTATFRTYGLICIVVLAVFVFINFYRKDTGFVSELPQTEDPHQVAEATHLAPHGVPSNAIPRALSSTRLHELANQDAGYGATYQTAGGNLAVPGANGGKKEFIREVEIFLVNEISGTIASRLITLSFNFFSKFFINLQALATQWTRS